MAQHDKQNGPAVVQAVCISVKKGTIKKPVPEITLRRNHGIEGDAHAGDWHRQVSLLSDESADKLRAKFPDLPPGAFAENILTSGIVLYEIPIGTRLKVGGAILEVTQIGKECHEDCEIRRKTGDCVMPREGVFAIVIEEGTVRAGDAVTVLGLGYTAAIVTCSDKACAGQRTDTSGPALAEMLASEGYSVLSNTIVADNIADISAELIRLTDEIKADFIITTGGTGFTPRDNTPEATKAVLDREAPGIAEYLRSESTKISRHGILSRGVSGIRGRTLIVNVPGSERAARECLGFLLPTLRHALRMTAGRDTEHSN